MTTSSQAPQKKGRLSSAALITLVVVGLCIVCAAASSIYVQSPGYKANRTATAISQLSRGATQQAIPSSTPVPSRTSVPSSTPVPSKTPAPTQTLPPTRTPLPPTATPIPLSELPPQEAVNKIARGILGAESVKATIGSIGTSSIASIDYDLGVQWDESTAVRSYVRDFSRMSQQIFQVRDIGTLELRAFTMFKDIYGKESSDVALKFTITRQASGKITWDKIDLKNIGRILSIEDGCGVYVHPALKSAWLIYQQ